MLRTDFETKLNALFKSMRTGFLFITHLSTLDCQVAPVTPMTSPISKKKIRMHKKPVRIDLNKTFNLVSKSVINIPKRFLS